MVKADKRHNKYCGEIFGYPPSNKSKEAQYFRKNLICPFRDNDIKCDPDNKISNLTDENGNRLVGNQTGACMAWHNPSWSDDPYPVIICPNRFFENNIIFKFIKKKFFDNKKIIVTGGIGIRPFGTVDGLIGEVIERRDLHLIGKIAHIEYQSDATTGTRGLVESVRDFNDGVDITMKDYNYGLNSKASIKGSSLQIIDKGYLFEELKIPSIWILQDYLFNYLRRIYNFDINDITSELLLQNEYLYFLTTTLNYNEEKDKFFLNIGRCYASSPSKMQASIKKLHSIKKIDLVNGIIRSAKRGSAFII